jgi:hypothetical protein
MAGQLVTARTSCHGFPGAFNPLLDPRGYALKNRAALPGFSVSTRPSMLHAPNGHFFGTRRSTMITDCDSSLG